MKSNKNNKSIKSIKSIKSDKPHTGTKSVVRACVALARPKHWIKNALVFVPLIYARSLTDPALVMPVLLCFAAFCLMSSAVYMINDIADAPFDRVHPAKRGRPIASGEVSAAYAAILAALISAASLGLSAAVPRLQDTNAQRVLAMTTGVTRYSVALILAAYLALNLAYSLVLKHFAVIDCFCIAGGFVLRIYAGGAACGERVSEWLFLTMTAVSLFLAFGKRRGELSTSLNHDTLPGATVIITRKALENYDQSFLSGMMYICSGLAVVFYAFWSMQSVSMMVYTVPLVIFIICKYHLSLYKKTPEGDPVTVLLGDKALIAAIAGLSLISLILLYI